MVFGLALSTTGAWLAADAWFFRGGEQTGAPGDRADARRPRRPEPERIVFGLTAAGLLVFGSAALVYSRLAEPALPAGPGLQAAAGLGPLLAAQAGLRCLRRPGQISTGLLLGAQPLSLLLNAVARQAVQIREVARFFDLSSVEVSLQLGPMGLFLAFFLAGTGVVAWLVVTFLGAPTRPGLPETP